ncbi:hypothetical protein TNCV_745901 [Trichonephila clavipes]|nr:hypothetical protein TNCV_745901 [Trichonephila clavipes]
MSRSGGQYEVRLLVFKFPSNIGTPSSTHCIRDERLSRPCPAREYNPCMWCGSAVLYHSTTEHLKSQMNSLAASVKLTYSASMVDRLTDFCLKVRHEIGVSSIKVMNPPIDTRSSLFVAKSESE